MFFFKINKKKINKNLVVILQKGFSLVELANNSEKLKSIKEKLIANKNNTPLFDTKLFVRNFEAALKQILN